MEDEDLQRLAERLDGGFKKLDASLDRISGALDSTLEDVLDLTHALRRRGKRYLHLVSDTLEALDEKEKSSPKND